MAILNFNGNTETTHSIYFLYFGGLVCNDSWRESGFSACRGEYFDLLGDNHRGIVSNFRQPVEKFPNFMKNTTVKIGPKHEKMPKYGIFMVEKFLTIVEYFLIFHKIFTPAFKTQN